MQKFNLIQVSRRSFPLEKTPNIELNLVCLGAGKGEPGGLRSDLSDAGEMLDLGIAAKDKLLPFSLQAINPQQNSVKVKPFQIHHAIQNGGKSHG